MGNYLLLEPIGSGGMGEVYRALDPRLGREVAVKLLHSRTQADPLARARFEREARAVAALSHPNLLVLYDIGESDGVRFVVTELLEGESLRQRLDRGPLPWRVATALAIEVAMGLEAAHRKGVIHRDLNPRNLFLVAGGEGLGSIKILDFGLATFEQGSDPLGASLGEDTTMAGSLVGTSGYISPEQVSGEIVDRRADLFALGCCLYEMVRGEKAFHTRTLADLITVLLQRDPPLLSDVVTEVPAALAQVVQRCLHKQREQRFATARELELALRQVLGETALSAAVPRAAAPPTLSQVASLAVLPFVGKDPEYLADGLAEGLVRALSRLAPLRIIGWSSTARYKGCEVDPARVGAALGVDALLMGQLQSRPDGGLRVEVELLGIPGARHLWGDGLSAAADQIASLAEELARRLAGALAGQAAIPWQPLPAWPSTVPGDEAASLQAQTNTACDAAACTPGSSPVTASLDTATLVLPTREASGLGSGSGSELGSGSGSVPGGSEPKTATPASASEAYRLYLKGRFFWNKRSAEGLRRARGFFQEALDLDPTDARAWVGLADAWAVQPFWGLASPAEAFPKAKAAARRALALDPSLAEAWASLGYVQFYGDWRWQDAENSFRTAIRLDPGAATALHWWGVGTALQGRFARAFELLHQAQAIDPLSAIVAADLALVAWWCGDSRRALAACRAGLELDDRFPALHLYRGLAHEQIGEIAEAEIALRHATELSGNATRARASLAHLLANHGRRAEAATLLQEIEAEIGQRYLSLYPVAIAQLGLGQISATFTTLERAFEERCETLVWLRVDPRLTPIRRDPRYLRLEKALSDQGASSEG